MGMLSAAEPTIFPLVLGGNTFGWTSDEAESHAVLDEFIARGGNLVDTADSYSAWAPGNSGGESESIIGSWLAKRGRRDDILIATKVAQQPGYRGLAPDNITAAVEQSLARLGTNHIDLYYAHEYDPDVPVAEVAAAFSRLVTEGKIRYIGISNFPAEKIDEWFDVAADEDFAFPVALQPKYNLVARAEFEGTLRKTAASHGMDVLPYYGLAAGFLTGKYRAEQDLEGSARASAAGGHLTEFGLNVIDVLSEVADECGAEIATVALAWLRRQPTVLGPIASARTVGQLPALMDSASLELSERQLQRLDAVSS